MRKVPEVLRIRFSWAFLLTMMTCGVCPAGPATPGDRSRLAIGLILGEEVLHSNVMHVCEVDASVDNETRYQQLVDWVFPAATHSKLRLTGGIRATDSSDGVVAPVLDLLAVARTLNRLPELRDRLAATAIDASNEQQRAKLAFQVMLAMELNDEPQQVEQNVAAIMKLLEDPASGNMHDIWPETVVATHGMRKRFRLDLIGDLLEQIKNRRTGRGIPAGFVEWHGLIYSLTQQSAYQLRNQKLDRSGDVADALRQWDSVPRQRGYSHGLGFAPAIWKYNGTEIEHVSGHDEDYLLYRSPLLGDLAVDFDLPADSQSQVYVGGNLFGPHWKDHFYVGDVRSGAVRKPLTPPLNHPVQWVHCRVEFQGTTRLCFLNGRRISTDELPETRFPWLGHHSWSRNQGRLRDVRITGHPTIPASIPLLTDAHLTGWNSYHEVEVGTPNSAWRFQEPGNPGEAGELTGLYQSDLAGSHCERLLLYQRPLLEDGAVEYDFFYEPGRFHVAPALGQLAFMLDPDHVRIHRITDDPFNRSELSPDNRESVMVDGFQKPQLRVSDWNHLRLTIAGPMVTLELNGQAIARHELDLTNSRQFGLFHFSDETGVRVRNAVLSGNWPQTLPDITNQELAHSKAAAIQAESARIQTVFQHKFSDGLPEEFFTIPPRVPGGLVELTEAGLNCIQQGTSSVVKSFVRSQPEAQGDFDVSVRYADWESTSHDFCGVSMELVMPSGHQLAVTRRVQNQDHHWAVLEWRIPRETGELQSYYQTLPTEATGGTLRVVRQGDVWHALYADHNSNIFRIIESVTMTGTAKQPVRFDLVAVAGKSGRTQFYRKEFRLAAQEIFRLSDAGQSKPAIFTMNQDGSDLRRVAQPTGDNPGYGSPDWSADGRQLLLDSWRGNASTSRVFLMNADGTNLKELGAGAMPTFAPDGQRLAFSGPQGMSIMQTDGTGLDVIATDGWGAQWSPDGEWVSYGTYRGGNDEGANIGLFNVKTRQRRTLLEGDHAKRYGTIYWNMEWSPDSQKICFKGSVTAGGFELAITDVAGSSQGLDVLTTQNVDTDLSWHPGGKKLLLPMPSRKHGGATRLFECDIASKTFTYLPNQPEHQRNSSGVWSPDGTRIALVSIPLLERTPWLPASPK